MIKIDKTEFDKLKYSDMVPVECDFCKQEYFVIKQIARQIIYKNRKFTVCSKECNKQYKFFQTRTLCKCINCQKEFYKHDNQIRTTNNNFCSKSCAGTYNNRNKKHGTRRSKLEKYIEEQLTILYPNLEVHYNRKDTIGSELDIYIPSLNLAIELNGIFHYEPIFGTDKLTKIQNNDNNKFQQCYEKKINFCIIDISKLSYFKPDNAKPYLDIITSIINKELCP